MTTAQTPAAGIAALLFKATREFYSSNLFICAKQSDALVTLTLTPNGSLTAYSILAGIQLKKGETYTISGMSLSEGDSLGIMSDTGDVDFVLTGTYI